MIVVDFRSLKNRMTAKSETKKKGIKERKKEKELLVVIGRIVKI